MNGQPKGHLDSDRLDCVTILPPATVPCSVTFNNREGLGYILCRKDLPSIDCLHLDCLVDAVHKL